MKSCVIDTFCAISQRLPRGFSRLSRPGVMLGGALCALTLSGCYYPYGYYPASYGYPYYATVPAGIAQQAVPVGQADASGSQDPQQAQAQAQQQAQLAQQGPPPTYAVAAPPVYAAPAYPAYYPPVYPAYYGYPGWYGPSVSIGFGFGGYWGGHGGGGWGGHGGHWH